uniref:ribosomal protein S3 n=1 Tax=Prototheca lentecrescens TaxID=2836214 RepID=UPI003002DF06
MGQKVHPLGFRLGITQKHQNYWYTSPKNSAVWLQDANFLRKELENIFNKAGLIDIEIQRNFIINTSFDVFIRVVRLNNFLYPISSKSPNNYESKPYSKYRSLYLKKLKTRKKSLKSSLTQLTNDLLKKLKRFYQMRRLPNPEQINCRLTLQKAKNPDSFATVLAQSLVLDLEKRKPYQKALQTVINKAKKAGIQGIKIKISGRLNGIDIARCADYKAGPIPLHTLRAKIDYSEKTAKTIYGLFGIKIWIYHGEFLNKFTNLKQED